MAWALALSGGGILGAAHLGVVRALREWGLQPELLAGTSAGGLVAGALAAGADLEELIAYGSRVAARPWEYLRPRTVRLLAELLPHDPLPPVDSLLDSEPFVQGLVALCPAGSTIQSWTIPTAVTAVDLAHEEAVAFVRPPAQGLRRLVGRWRLATDAALAVALQATMAMPGIYRPVRHRDAFLVDGGVADTLPTDWATALGADRILAVNVAPLPHGLPLRAGMLWSLSRSFSYAVNTLSALRQPPQLPILTLVPDTAGVPAFGFQDYTQLVAAGYATAQQQQGSILRFLAPTKG